MEVSRCQPFWIENAPEILDAHGGHHLDHQLMVDEPRGFSAANIIEVTPEILWNVIAAQRCHQARRVLHG